MRGRSSLGRLCPTGNIQKTMHMRTAVNRMTRTPVLWGTPLTADQATRCARGRVDAMTRDPVPSLEALARPEKGALERPALEWRADAPRGQEQADGVAHARKVDLRRRVRAGRAQQVPPLASAPRRCWKFWPAPKIFGLSPTA